MKSSTNVSKPPKKKKKIIGYTQKKSPGEVVQKGKPAEVKMSFEREKVKNTYTPTKVETGHPAYGKPGGGTDKEMNKLIGEAQAKKRDVTAHSSKGLNYRAGTTTTERTPEKLHTTMKVTPEIRKVKFTKTPIYEKGAKKAPAKLKSMDVTLGGSNKKGDPANKTGLGKKKKTIIRKVKSFPKR